MELNIVHFLNQLGQGTVIDEVTFYFSWLPFLISFWLMVALSSLIFNNKYGRMIFLGTFLIFIIYFVLNDLIIKQTLASIFFRERPYIAYPNIIISSGEIWVDSSFPSGHLAITLSFLTFYLYFYHRWWTWVITILFVILMAFARIHNGMHYPTDILGGIVFGIGYGYLSIFIVKKIHRKFAK